MSARWKRTPAKGQQCGSVLFVSLIILLVLSLLAISTANTAISENKMAAAARSMQLARFAADSAVNEAKVRIAGAALAHGATEVCANLRCFVRPRDAPYEAEQLMRTDAAQAAATVFRIDFTQLAVADESSRLAASPSYLIEDLGAAPPSLTAPAAAESRLFRITSHGVGGTSDIEQFAETVIEIAD